MFRLTTVIFGSLLIICWPEISLANRLPKPSDSFDSIMSMCSSVDIKKIVKEHVNDKSESLISEDDRAAISKLKELSQDITAAKSAIVRNISTVLYKRMYEISNMFSLMGDIEFVYQEYLTLLENIGRRALTELQNFADGTTCNFGDLSSSIFSIHYKLHECVYILKYINIHPRSEGVTLCSTSESPQELLKNLYDIVLKCHAQVLLIQEFSFTLTEHFAKRNYSREFRRSSNLDLWRFEREVNETYNIVKAGMEVLPRFLYRCDPEKYEEGVNFEKLGPVLQTHIVLTADLPNDRGGQCKVKKDKHSYYSDFSREIEVSKRCEEGYIRDCQLFGPEFEVCYSDNSSPRLYDWVKISNHHTFGYKSDSDCRNMAKEERLSLFWKLYRNYCLCTCDSGRIEEDRYFSLRRVESDTLNNKIVTGVQLVKKRRVFYLMIQEGEFGYNGTINGDPVWRDVPEYEDDVQERTDNTDFSKNPLLYSVTYDSREVQLDELTVGQNEVITGIKFSRSGKDLILEIRATPCDYDNGTLKDSESYWINGTAFSGVRQVVELTEPEVPITSDYKADMKIASNHQFVRFRATDKSKDLGQNTVPFLDTQPITTSPPMPLTGAGLILKCKGYSGGFLALELNHYDLVS